MHAPPPVRMVLVPSDAWHGFISLCTGIAAGNLVAWVAQWVQIAPLRLAAASLVAVLVTMLLSLAVLRRHDRGTGELLWDGAGWLWTTVNAPAVSGDAQVMVDLGAWVLLRWVPVESPGHAVWLVASRRSAGAIWPAARAALYAQGPRSEPTSAMLS